MNYKETKGADIYFEDDSIFRIVFKAKVAIDKEIAEEIVATLRSYEHLEPHANLVDASNLFFMSNDARNVFASPSDDAVKAVAIVVKNKIQSGFANLYMKFTKRAIETKVFSNPESAKEWLLSKLNN